MPRISKVYQLTEDEFRHLITTHFSYADCARALGMSVAGSNSYNQLRKRVKELNIDITHFSNTTNANKASTQYSLEEIMIENSTYANTTRFKERLIKANLIPYQCAICGNTGEWNHQPLVLQLDHINGKHNDHRKENLRFLCPNCHSQTETFSGRNK